MRQTLILHPDSSCGAVTGIEVDIVRSAPRCVDLHYVVRGRIAGIRLPTTIDPSPADPLWRHSCFEMFARAAGASAYEEWNLAPSGRWAHYRLASYRAAPQVLPTVSPDIVGEAGPDRYDLRASAALPDDGPLRLGLSAVIEETDGNLSYWALAHPPTGPRDFHHDACFALELPAFPR